MKRLSIYCLTCLIGAGPLLAQQGVTQCGTPTGQPKFPLGIYQELPDPEAPSEEEWATFTATQVSWGTTDVRYAKHQLPRLKPRHTVTLKGWRGERVNAQAVVWTGTELENLNLGFSGFKDKKGNLLPVDAFSAGFVRYVMTDELNKDGRGACGYRKSVNFDSLLVADPIDAGLESMKLPARTVQPVWVQCRIPQSAVPGTYKGELQVKDGSRLLQRLNLEITVSFRELPQPSEWAYHLDLWQSPYAVARYYQVPLWSQEHLEAMRPLMKMLANAGQKIITATLTHKPWNGQTEDYFDTMVTWIKRADGTWLFDYTVFDRWVEFMMSVGIDKQINCYSMVPWKLSFQYYDQATNSLKFIKAQPGEQAYEEMWVAMLTSFARHLKAKGWFDICTIAMDERPMDVMQKTLEVIRKADAGFKVSLAGNYHAEIDPDLYDYCIAIGQDFPEEVRLRRAAEKKRTTYYTCCTEAHPNTFTFSEPAEATWISFYSAKKHLDGYLRWAYNSWPLEPLLDSRFHTWAGGDTYLVYPGARSSIRFERLIEGIQAHEKITILRREFEREGNKSGLRKIEKMLAPFKLGSMPEIPAAVTVNRANQILNSF
ncbi:glycoside hydrolase domain-containing protein [uncultured Bacteroides sp.]|uniref:DUF4091 domain-containing protein n=1 Tax=uncultured Bacteroides sp. TaxID=162156 RepID=UPI00267761B0|nr:glycoside hydrolase domain-containing protein [uncultured Bacteroides sp.]